MSKSFPNEYREKINKVVSQIFKKPSDFKHPESLAISLTGILNEEDTRKYSEEVYGVDMIDPKITPIPVEVISFYSKFEVIPYKIDLTSKRVYLGVYYENRDKYVPEFKDLEVHLSVVSLPWYVSCYTRMHGIPSFLYPIPSNTLFNMIVDEAINRKASDISFVSQKESVAVFFDIRKNKVRSHCILTVLQLEEILQGISSKAKRPIPLNDFGVKEMDVDLDLHHRGRVEVSYNKFGPSITIRIIDDAFLSATLSDLNIDKASIEFLSTEFINREGGLRLLVGGTSSGKNTTALTALKILADTDRYKIISIESPVEYLVEGIDQQSAISEVDFKEKVRSVIRQNPDMLYIPEMSNITAEACMEISNINKPVFSSVHASSIAGVVSRIHDLSGWSLDNIIMNLHSVVFQELIRDDEKDMIFPKLRHIRFTTEVKSKLLGRGAGEIYLILSELERGIAC
jgi:Tfp pilus assembly pilus retraction ATPase PilT